MLKQRKKKKEVSTHFSGNSMQGLQEILLETHLKQKFQTASPPLPHHHNFLSVEEVYFIIYCFFHTSHKLLCLK